MIYWPKPHAEVDLTPLLQAYPQKTWFLPGVSSEGNVSLEPYVWPSPLRWMTPPGVFQPCVFQASHVGSKPEEAQVEPQAHTITPDLAILPVLAADLDGHRLGHGAGAYDRWWASLPPETRPNIVLAAPLALQVAALPQDPWDLKADGILSEAGLMWL